MAVLSRLDVQLIDLSAIETVREPVEDGETFAENARKKALHYSRCTDLPTIADDSGLEVDVLGGRPGVYSARYAPSDEERISKLLRELGEHADQSPWSARFVCAICLAWSGEVKIEADGIVRGEIVSPRGHGGFGYDPVFFHPPSNLTFGEMSSSQKNRISHRALALQKLKEEIAQELTGG